MGYLFCNSPSVILRRTGQDNGTGKWYYRIDDDGRFTEGQFYSFNLRSAHKYLRGIVKHPNKQIWIRKSV